VEDAGTEEERLTGLEMRTGTMRRVPALIVCSVVATILVRIIFSNEWRLTSEAGMSPTVREIGNLLMIDYLIPFEIVSVLLLAALVGAAYIARREAR